MHAAAAAVISAWWADADMTIPTNFRLVRVKAAQIDVSGHYPADSEAVIHDYSPVVNGGGIGASPYPLQVAHVHSLTTAAERGRAHEGRVYLPPPVVNLSGDQWSWPDATCLTRATRFAELLFDLNATFAGPATVFSSVGAGTKRAITGVRVGDRPDVQRRRAGSLTETYQAASL